MTFLKHESNNGGGKRAKRTPKNVSKSSDTRVTVEASGLEAPTSGVEVELANIARSVRTYVTNANNGENTLCLYSDASGSSLRLELEGDAVTTIAESLKRIADALTARQA